MSQATEWGHRATELYRPEYARRYRKHDDGLAEVESYRMFCRWLQDACERFDHPIDVLDLGCGTGRYFRALTGVRALVGIDVSAAMLEEAKHPVGADSITVASIELIEGDILTHAFAAGQFDLVYAVGVLAEHTPLSTGLVRQVWGWLRPGGRFAFTTVHPDSPSIPRTVRRTAGRLVLPLTAGTIHRWLRNRITAGGLYADEALVRARLEPRFEVETLTRAESEAHLHCLCIARKALA